MVTFGTGLAQAIVERTMKVIPFSVNVMDTMGIIIASGNPARIGNIHPGAQLALARKETIEIDSLIESTLPGARAGINLPLTVRSDICGVVGITGNPESVRQFGELVRVTAEMILEQAQLIDELQREKRYREEFVVQLIKNPRDSDVSMTAWAARVGVNLAQPRAMFVLELPDGRKRPDIALAELHQLQMELSLRKPELLTAVISPTELVMLEAFDHLDKPGSPFAISLHAHKRLQELSHAIQQAIKIPSTLSMGISLPGIDGAVASYESARQTASVGKTRTPQESVFSYYDFSLPVLLSGLEHSWQKEQLCLPLKQLEMFDRKSGTLLKTLSAWFKHNSHAMQTSKALHIHRNTLDYRLQKIGELTGLDLDNMDDCMHLYVALQLQK